QRWMNEHFDLVHSHFWMSGIAAVFAAEATGIPVTHTFHALGSVKRRYQGSQDTSPPERIGLEAGLCNSVDRVIATCLDEVHELRSMGLDPARATVIPCGVDVGRFRPGPRLTGSDTKRQPYRLLSVGRLVERKGVQDVIRALEQLPDAELVVVGGPTPDSLALDPDVMRLSKVAASVGVSDRVQFTGGVSQEEMPELFCSADLVTSVPWYEPFGIVPLEAMACGRPVVGSAVGGLLDTIVPGVTGELVPPRDPVALAQTLRELLDDPARRNAYGRAGPARVRDRYRWERIAVRTRAVYAEVTASVTSEVPS
ncbi:MAG: glycosyltransferase, partial [Actinophytocola sp.]|nr:glycosyltransferase [Actinophytocola sp.]